jgi:hypothetical protein
MGARQWINDHQRMVSAIAGTFLVVALCFIASRVRHEPGAQRSTVKQAFFSDDDGKTYFQDSAAKLPPFDHNGMSAYGAVVLRCPGGQPFVAFLLKYDIPEIPQLEERIRQSETPNLILSSLVMQAEVKKPGESRWVSFSGDPKGYARITTPMCPGGGDAFTSVVPGDPDSGATN